MRAVDKNISRHENGTLYYVARVNGRLLVKSLRTKEIKEAKERLRQIVAGAFNSVKPEVPVATRIVTRVTCDTSLSEGGLLNPPPVPVPVPTVPVPKITLADAVAIFKDAQIYNCKGTKDMLVRGCKLVLEHSKDLASFNPAFVWSSYRNTGVGPACNHLRWCLRRFVPFGIKRGWFAYTLREDLEQIPLIKVNPRNIRIPSVEAVDEFLKMVEFEDKEAGSFLRFLASSGLRLSGGNRLKWEDVDFTEGLLRVLQKGSKISMTPLTTEALAILQERRDAGNECPFGFGERRIKKIGRLMKKFAKGFEMDLTFFHAFRHYFASRALMSGLGVQEVAALLGHADGGQLVLRTYGHLTSDHLRKQVSRLRLTSPSQPNEQGGSASAQ